MPRALRHGALVQTQGPQMAQGHQQAQRSFAAPRQIAPPQQAMARRPAPAPLLETRSPAIVDCMMSWRALEARDGVIDLHPLEVALAAAYQRHQRVSLRLATIDITAPSACPDDVQPHSRGGFTVAAGPPHSPFRSYVPDVNDPYVLARMRRVVEAVARDYDGDPRLAWVIIGLLGDGGRWDEASLTYPRRDNLLAHPDPLAPLAQPSTLATQRAVVRSFTEAFRSTRLLVPTSLSGGARLAFQSQGNVGAWLGSPREMSVVPPERWRTAPVVAWAGKAWTPAQTRAAHLAALVAPRTPTTKKAPVFIGYHLTLHQVQAPAVLHCDSLYRIDSWWNNRGTAPAYEPLRLTWSLRKSPSQAAVWQSPSRLGSAPLAPASTPQRVRDSGRLPADLAPGRYVLCLGLAEQAYWQDLAPVTAVATVEVRP